jgi:hypothetical protein
MTNLSYFVGNYNIVGNQLINNEKNIKLLVSKRVQISEKKSTYFLLNKSVPKGAYISSLYECASDSGIECYNFDYQKVKYVLTINKEKQVAEVKIR